MSQRKTLFILAVLVALTTLGFSQHKLSQYEKTLKHTQSDYASLEKKLDEVTGQQLRIEKERKIQDQNIEELTAKISEQQTKNAEMKEQQELLNGKIVKWNRDIQTLEARIRSNKKQMQQVSRGSGNVTKQIRMEATGYTAYCTGCSGTTATGINLRANPNAKVIAVDPRVIPLGTKVWVEGYGYAIAGDTGGAIKGYKIDVHFATKSQAYAWGRRTVLVKILN